MQDQESERIKRVYAGYSEQGLRQSKWSLKNPGNLAIRRERSKVLLDMLTNAKLLPLTNKRILEIGCGAGQIIKQLISFGADPARISGVDLVEDLIQSARLELPDVDLRVADARFLPFDTESFDLVLTFTVFSSILDNNVATQVAQEARRLLKQGGTLVCYDFRYDSPGNPNVRGVKRIDMIRHFPEFTPTWSSLTLLPPLARRLGFLTSVAYPVLVALPFLRTHQFGFFVKPSQSESSSCV